MPGMAIIMSPLPHSTTVADQASDIKKTRAAISSHLLCAVSIPAYPQQAMTRYFQENETLFPTRLTAAHLRARILGRKMSGQNPKGAINMVVQSSASNRPRKAHLVTLCDGLQPVQPLFQATDDKALVL